MLNIRSCVELNNGVRMPMFGLGVFRSAPGEPTRAAVRTALEYGYTMIDTARIYCNEKSVGRGIKDAQLPRDQYFVTTKLWKTDFDNPRRGLEQSLERLGLDYVDLYLLHWPFKGYAQAYLELEKLQKEGLCKAIGVSNFKEHHLAALKAAGAVVTPQVNQVECHPLNSMDALLSCCRKQGIAFEAYSPLGGQDSTLLSDPRICALADYHKVSTAQIILRWHLQRGVIVIPKSVHPERILQNSMLYDFELTQDEMDTINSLNANLGRAFDSDRIDERPESTFPEIIEEI